MTITLQIIGFHNCDGCSKKVRIALRRIGVRLVKLDRDTGNVTIETAENPEVIREALARQLKKSVVILSGDELALVPANQIPNYFVSQDRTLDLNRLGEVVLRLAQILDGVEITNSNTMRIKFIHRGASSLVVTPNIAAYAPPRQPEPSAPPVSTMTEQVVYGYPRDFYGACNHDHPNRSCTIM